MDEHVPSAFPAYSNVIARLAGRYGIHGPGPCAGARRIDQVIQLVDTIVRERCRQAVEEARLRIWRLAARHLPDSADEGLYVPATEIYIDTGNVGTMRLSSFRGHRDDPFGI